MNFKIRYGKTRLRKQAGIDAQPAIIASNVGKRFRRYHGDRTWTFQELLVNGFRRVPAGQFWGLRNISFAVEQGSTVGLIGRNGAGKSTLLRLLGGIGVPDEGKIEVRGGVAGLLALGAGFHGDLTGRENVFVAGVVGGATRKQVRERFDAIVDFAEVREFIDAPVRTYSSGMMMRLAFSVAIHVQPRILLVDEVLAVGDVGFQEKCLRRIAAIKRQGCTIILVSHDETTVRDLCDKVLWLDAGRMVSYGPTASVMDEYLREMGVRAQRALDEETRRRTPAAEVTIATRHGSHLRLRENRFGSLEVEILDVRILGSYETEVSQISPGDSICIEIDYGATTPVGRPLFKVAIVGVAGKVFLEVTGHGEEPNSGSLDGNGTMILRVDGLNLPEGSYWIQVGIFEQSWAYGYDTHDNVYPLTVRSEGAAPPPSPPAPVTTRWLHVSGGIVHHARV
jgi:lipopolysaccharide transport system ATP-binding protein